MRIAATSLLVPFASLALVACSQGETPPVPEERQLEPGSPGIVGGGGPAPTGEAPTNPSDSVVTQPVGGPDERSPAAAELADPDAIGDTYQDYVGGQQD